jgi:hypothetical protein
VKYISGVLGTGVLTTGARVDEGGIGAGSGFVGNGEGVSGCTGYVGVGDEASGITGSASVGAGASVCIDSTGEGVWETIFEHRPSSHPS